MLITSSTPSHRPRRCPSRWSCSAARCRSPSMSARATAVRPLADKRSGQGEVRPVVVPPGQATAAQVSRDQMTWWRDCEVDSPAARAPAWSALACRRRPRRHRASPNGATANWSLIRDPMLRMSGVPKAVELSCPILRRGNREAQRYLPPIVNTTNSCLLAPSADGGAGTVGLDGVPRGRCRVGGGDRYHLEVLVRSSSRTGRTRPDDAFALDVLPDAIGHEHVTPAARLGGAADLQAARRAPSKRMTGAAAADRSWRGGRSPCCRWQCRGGRCPTDRMPAATAPLVTVFCGSFARYQKARVGELVRQEGWRRRRRRRPDLGLSPRRPLGRRPSSAHRSTAARRSALRSSRRRWPRSNDT